jgi:hypothetical protein
MYDIGPAALTHGGCRVSLDTGAQQWMGLHAGAVRDVRAAPAGRGGDDCLLSTGFDARLRVFDCASARHVVAWKLPAQRRGWSCAWSVVDPMQVSGRSRPCFVQLR